MEHPAEVYVRLGQRIRQLRRERGLSQEQLSLAGGFNRAYVGFIERAERQASIETVARLAAVLGVDLHECFRWHSAERTGQET